MHEYGSNIHYGNVPIRNTPHPHAARRCRWGQEGWAWGAFLLCSLTVLACCACFLFLRARLLAVHHRE